VSSKSGPSVATWRKFKLRLVVVDRSGCRQTEADQQTTTELLTQAEGELR